MVYHNRKTCSSPRKLAVIVGPTASGKSALAVTIAKKFNGEVISADSRQVYKRLDIGTGKITRKEMSGIPHHLLDVASPKRTFTASQYQKLARKAIQNVWRRGKLPVVCGGTGLYIRAIIDGLVMPGVKPNAKLRRELEKKTPAELSLALKRMDPRRWREIDRQNPRRLIRAIEIATALGRVPKLKSQPISADVIFLGIDKDKLESAIQKRVKRMIKNGIIAETEKLRQNGVTDRKIREFGFEYAGVLDYLEGRLVSKKELAEKMTEDTLKYVKRQRTWFRKDKRIIWVNSELKATQMTKGFMKRNAKVQMTNDKSMTNA